MTKTEPIRGTLFLREAGDVDRLLLLLSDLNIGIDPNAIVYACNALSDDWLTIWAGDSNSLCSLKIEPGGTTGINVFHWAEALKSLFELRQVSGIEEQVRRLRLVRHERLDTALCLIVAARYQQQRFKLEFEPNGAGCSDLRVSKTESSNGRFYVEVKRVNTQDHSRPANLRALASAVSESLSHSLAPWLEKSERRLEVKLSQGAHLSRVTKIAGELAKEAPIANIAVETPLAALKHSSFVVLERESDAHYEKGMFCAQITIKEAGVPVQIAPRNMPVRIGFDWTLNLTAIRGLIKKASRQIARDQERDVGAEGMIVLQSDGGEHLAKVIEERFLPNLQDCCFGITLISDPSSIIAPDGLPESKLELMKTAAIPFFGGGPPQL